MLVRALPLVIALFSSAVYADTYDVQIGAFRNPNVASFDVPTNVGELRSLSGSDGLTRFVVGPFSSRAEAEQARDRLQGSGFAGAFVRTGDAGGTVIRESAYVSGSDSASVTYAEQDSASDTSMVSAGDEEGEVVYLDGKLHRKVGSRFIPVQK